MSDDLNLASIIGGKDVLMVETMKDKLLVPKRNPALEVAMKATLKAIKNLVIEKLYTMALPRMQDVLETYYLVNGEFEDVDADDLDNYSQGIDDQVEDKIAKYEHLLSADWLGTKTIDTRLWEDGAVDKFTRDMAKEVYKQLTFGLTPAKIMSAAGIVEQDVADALAHHLTSTGDVPMAGAQTLENLIAKIKAHVGEGYDLMSVYADLDDILEESDEILRNSTASRIGLSPEDAIELQNFGLEFDVDEMSKMLAESKGKVSKAKGKAKKKAAPAAPAADVEGAIDPSVLLALKTCGIGDTALAGELGISRSTYTGYCKGKAFIPDAEQLPILRDHLVGKANTLLSALASLDGTEANVVG